jgi:hypothetical protein
MTPIKRGQTLNSDEGPVIGADHLGAQSDLKSAKNHKSWFDPVCES